MSYADLGRPPADLRGERYGRLVALRLDHMGPGARGAYWACRCDCGAETVVSRSDLRQGRTSSCGCLWREAMRTSARSKATTKLTWVDVREIQNARRAWVVPLDGLPGRVPMRELALRYDVSITAISDALKVQIPSVQKKRGRPPKPR